jgi:LysR family transcriptional regulator (chromosome initiation inhibitor)
MEGQLLRLDHDALAFLAAIIRTGSFEGAARSLGVTQSAISQRIKQLEEAAGSILIVRSKPCVPTDMGLVLFSHFEQLELLQAATLSKLSGEGGQIGTTRVRVSINYDSLATWFPYVIRQSSQDLGVRFEIVSDDQEFTEQSLRSGDALAALSTSRLDIPGCRRVPLGTMEYAAIASPEFCSRYFNEGVNSDTLAKAPSIAFDPKDTLPDQWMSVCTGRTPELNSHQVPSFEGHMICATDSVGWAIMPLISVGEMIKEGSLVDLSPSSRVSVRLNWYYTMQTSQLLVSLSSIVEEKAKEWLVPYEDHS